MVRKEDKKSEMATPSDPTQIDLTGSPESGRKSPSTVDLSAGMDELIVDNNKVPLVTEAKSSIKEMFDVEIKLGLVSSDKWGKKRWIDFHGQSEKRKLAKDYVRTLCNPLETQTMPYPPELHALLTNPTIRARLETTTKAVLQFPTAGEVAILGLDTLAVTLAWSALEDVINKHMDITAFDPEETMQKPSNSHSSDRLDVELRRLSSQEGNKGVLENDYSGVNDAVKRTILSWMMEDNDVESEGKTIGKDKKDQVHALGIPVQQLEQIQLDSRSSQLQTDSPMELEETEKSDDEVDGIDLHPRIAQSMLLPKVQESARMEAHLSLPEDMAATGAVDSDEYLIDLAMQKGYTEADIQEVFSEYGKAMKASEFMRALITNGRLKGEDAKPKVRKISSKSSTQSTALPKPPSSDQLASSPHLKPQIMENEEKKDALKLSVHLMGYVEQRGIDAQEEEDCDDREELMRKNKKRQDLLRVAYKKREEEKQVRGQKTGGQAQNEDPSPIVDLTEDGLPPEEGENDVATGGVGKLDQLDEFSLPYDPKVGPSEGAVGGNFPGQKRNYHSDSPQNRDAKKKPHQYRDRSGSPGKSNFGQRPINRSPSPHYRKNKRPPSPKKQGFMQPPAQYQGPGQGQMHGHQGQGQMHGYPGQGQMQGHDLNMPPPTIPLRTNLRYIVIDGSNVALTHGNGRVFSCKGIQICVDYFRRHGHTEITAFVPQWRTRNNPDKPISHQHLLEELREQGFLVFTPARRVPGKNIVCYDDKFILRLAEQTEGIMVSNDNYRDLWAEKYEWRQIIEKRLMGFSFVGDIFMPPDDPLGRHGPTLDDFLKKDPTPHPQQPRNQPLPIVGMGAHAATGIMGPYPLQLPPPHPAVSGAGGYMPMQGGLAPDQESIPRYNQHPNQPQQKQPGPNRDNPYQWQKVQGKARQSRFSGNQQQQQNERASYHGNTQVNHGKQQHGRRQQQPKEATTLPHMPPEPSGPPPRTPDVTKQLFEALGAVFEGSETIIQDVLDKHPGMTDINRLSDLVLRQL